MNTITTQQLIDLVRDTKGATFATITLATTPRMRKTDNPYFGKIVKNSVYNVCINFDYENSVNYQRAREDKDDDFKRQDTWGEHETPSIVWKDSVAYLQVKLEKKLDETYVDTTTGAVIAKDVLSDHLYSSRPSKTQDVDKQVICLRPKFENVVGININGESYIVQQ